MIIVQPKYNSISPCDSAVAASLVQISRAGMEHKKLDKAGNRNTFKEF